MSAARETHPGREPSAGPEPLESRDHDELLGQVMAELAIHSEKFERIDLRFDQFDKRLDDSIANHAALATTLAVSARTASQGGWLAAGGGGLMGAVEVGRLIGHALGWW